jgi:hypothetical protein
MADENETKKLLGFKASLETRLREINQEMTDIRTALEEINGLLVTTGFRTFSTPTTSTPIHVPSPEPENLVPDGETTMTTPPSPPPSEEELSITGKDGTQLGTIIVEENTLVFTPSEVFQFTTDIPPFRSFLLERVLDNMRRTDQERASNGELEPQDILEYTVETDGDRISKLSITNFGGERRLRELNSSLRWTLDKMYDKLREG